MSRVDDVIYNFIHTRGCAGLNEDSRKLLSDAVRYGFEQSERFGKYVKYAEKVQAEYLIQPENDRAWQEELDDIMKDCRNVTCRSAENKQVRLLGLIAEMILYRRRGG